jgi:hypothetical protein
MKPIAVLVFLCALAGTAEAASDACRETAGRAQAKLYVEQCLTVSPATHPPCNGDNPCDLIVDEIRRGCALIRSDRSIKEPEFCRTYLPSSG